MATYVKTALVSSQTTGQVIPVNYFCVGDNPISVYLAITNTPTMVASVEVTLDNIYDSSVTPVWFTPAAGFAGLTASTFLSIAYPVRAIRLNVTSWTAGDARITVLQGD